MKKYLIILATILSAALANAQGFSSFSVKGELQETIIKNNANRLSTVEGIVAENVDIKNVDFKYRMLSNSFLSKDLTKDFSEPQYVTIERRNGDAREWMIAIKQLKSAPLPLSISFSEDNPSTWNASTTGWAAVGIDETKPTVARFGNRGVSFYIAFNEPATSLAFELKPVSREKVVFDGVFTVETSHNGVNWSALDEYSRKNGIKEDGLYTYPLADDVRFVRWTYKDRNKLNINLNNIRVSN